MNLWAVLIKLQTSNGSQFSKESERVKPNENAYTYSRVLQQDTREEASPLESKARNNPTESSAPRWPGSQGPQPSGPSHSHFDTTYDDAAHARALQAELDSEQASFDLARRLQAENDAMLREHQQLVREEARFKVFDCVICMETFPEGDSAPVRSCRHVLCRTCMKNHVQSQVDQAIWPVRCPVCVADPNRTQGHGGEYGRIPRLQIY